MIKFGTGGWRAVIGDEFTKANLQLLAKAVADLMHEEGVAQEGIVIGYDRRFLSKEAMQWLACVFAAEGIETFLINKSAPTPLVMFYVAHHDLHYGMMVTASHNPALYNGVKVFTEGGRDANEEKTAQIEEQIGRILSAKKDETQQAVTEMPYEDGIAGGMIHEIYPLNEYLDSIIDTVNMDAIKKRGLRIALDPMYGVSETSLKTILMTARCEVETIHERHDTLFGGKLPAPTQETLKSLQEYVLDRHCDLGIATDGDADRIGVIDDEGNFLHPNDILVLLYYYLHKYKGWTGPAVRNICTTHLLDRVAASFSEQCYEVPVGFKHISAKMYATNAIIGGESSGGMAVRGHIRGKDGIYASALLVEMIAVTGKKLSELMQSIREEFGGMQLIERDYRFTPARKEEIRQQLLIDKQLPDLPFLAEKVSYLDGLKIYFAADSAPEKSGGWISVRFSGTEPLLRIFCEMDKREDAEKLCATFESFLAL
ncbi:MAG: phosphoglucomutase/phosphomannomutase family protein [Lachnospiraceae bacterium]|nr:phosphoglucomutase/phosphomannomutase family protein [Lachnospiraceae bacterium]